MFLNALDHLLNDWDLMLQNPTASGVDLYEQDGGYVIAIEVPGRKVEDAKIELLGDRLTVEFEALPKLERAISTGRYRGSVRRVFKVPAGLKETDFKATYEQGVLYIRFQEPEAMRPRRLQITV